MGIIVQAVLIGMLVMLAGTIPRNLFFANLQYYTGVPWAVPVTAVYLWFFWQYLNGAGPPESTTHGLVVAILITGTMFAIAHPDFTVILWPHYVAVAAIYGTVTYLARSILPAVVLHTGGNIYSNLDLWLHGQAEWQAASGPSALIWTTGADRSFWVSSAALLIVAAAAVWAYVALARVVVQEPT